MKQIDRLRSLVERALLPKGKFITLSREEALEMAPELRELIDIAYAPIGGHLKIRSDSDIGNYTFWQAADLDDDPEPDVVLFGKRQGSRIKHAGSGHDGERSHIKTMLTRATSMLKSKGNYIEVSGKLYDVLSKRGGVPAIEDEETVRSLLGNKEIEWHGDGGWYSRDIAGQRHRKIILGNP